MIRHPDPSMRETVINCQLIIKNPSTRTPEINNPGTASKSINLDRCPHVLRMHIGTVSVPRGLDSTTEMQTCALK